MKGLSPSAVGTTLLLALSSLLSFQVQAALVTYSFTASYDSGNSSYAGSEITGTFTYDTDSTAPTGSTEKNNWSGSEAVGFTLTYTVTNGGGTIASGTNNTSHTNSPDIEVRDNYNGNYDSFLIETRVSGTESAGIPAVEDFILELKTFTELNAIQGVGSLPTMLVLGDFENATVELTLSGEDAYFTLSELTQVPLPAAAYLFGSALFGLFMARRSRGKAKSSPVAA